jgi:hypothetical protein
VYRNSGRVVCALICFVTETIDEHATYNIKNYYRLMFYNEKKEILTMEIIVEGKVKL